MKQPTLKQQLKQEFISICKTQIEEQLNNFINLPPEKMKKKRGKIAKETRDIVDDIKTLQSFITSLRKL